MKVAEVSKNAIKSADVNCFGASVSSIVPSQNFLSFKIFIQEEILVSEKEVDIQIEGHLTLTDLHNRVSTLKELPVVPKKGYKYSYFTGEKRIFFSLTQLDEVFDDNSRTHNLWLNLESAKINILFYVSESNKPIQIVAMDNVPCSRVLHCLCDKYGVSRNEVNFLSNSRPLSNDMSFEDQGVTEASEIQMVMVKTPE